MPEPPTSAPVPEDLIAAWSARGWPADLLQSAFDLHISRRQIEWWLRQDDRGLERARNVLPQLRELTLGSIRGREATHLDNDRFSDLWANAPEEIGDWEIIVERAPNAFAQFQLQENVSIPVLEERGVLLACVVWSGRNLLVGGQRLTVHCAQGLRVRREGRGSGYGNLVRVVPRPVWFPYISGQYHYMRSQNYAAVDFFKHTSPGVVASSPERDDDVPGIPVTVYQYPGRERSADAVGVRTATRADLRRCVSLINRTHRGQDLFRPYVGANFELKLDYGAWGSRPVHSEHVYGWEDYYVVEEKGQVVACGGLWDRGRDVREHWRNRVTGEERRVAPTALLDFGFASGFEHAMAKLIAYFIGETHRLGRDYLVAPLQQLPAVASLLNDFEPVTETRALGWFRWDETGQDLPPDPPIKRPYTDLAYW
jgi:hypothetical protein